MKKKAIFEPCPCGSSKDYHTCCGLLHSGRAAADAEALMRSRYSAYAHKQEAYLLATWHPATRPKQLRLADENPATKWIGLTILRHENTDARHSLVEFVAKFKVGGGSVERLHEVSRFVCEKDGWYYVDGDY